jgi:hypothetical protein
MFDPPLAVDSVGIDMQVQRNRAPIIGLLWLVVMVRHVALRAERSVTYAFGESLTLCSFSGATLSSIFSLRP